MIRDHIVIELLEHEVAVARNAFLRKIHHGRVTAVSVEVLGKCQRTGATLPILKWVYQT